MRGSARLYDVRMAQFVLKIEKLSHIMGPRASQDLRSPSLIMAPGSLHNSIILKLKKCEGTVFVSLNFKGAICNLRYEKTKFFSLVDPCIDLKSKT